VRRLISYIEKTIELGTQWVVFEPNDEDLWARVSRTVEGFLTRLWRDGALFGASPNEAFYVKCDGELNTPDTMMLGRLYVEVGFARCVRQNLSSSALASGLRTSKHFSSGRVLDR
jgi:phage tail sheath protein FI